MSNHFNQPWFYYSVHDSFFYKMGLDEDEVWFIEPSHSALFVMFVKDIGFLDVEERLLCLHFDIEPGWLVIVEREEYDNDMVLMRTILQRPHFCIPRWSYQVTPRYYKVLSLASPISGSKQFTPTPQLISSFNVSKSEKKVSRLPIIVESPEIKVRCLSSDLESGSEKHSDSEDVVVVAKVDDFTSGSVGAQDFDCQYPCCLENIDVRSDGIVKSEDDYCESFNPSQGIGSEKTIKASEWLASTHGISFTIGDSYLIASETLSQGSDSGSGFKCTPQSVSVGCYGPQLSSEDKCNESLRNIMELLLTICGRPSARSHLRSADLSSFKQEVVPHLPIEFNDNLIFELPSLPIVKERGVARLDGMDWKFDGHA